MIFKIVISLFTVLLVLAYLSMAFAIYLKDDDKGQFID